MLKRQNPFAADNELLYEDCSLFLILQWIFCLDAISTAFLWSFVNVIYKPLHNCSLQSRLQGPAFLLSDCRSRSVFNKDAAYCVFPFTLQQLWPILHSNEPDPLPIPANCWTGDMGNAGDHTLSSRTCTHFLTELPFKAPLALAGSGKRLNCPCPQQSHAHEDFWLSSEPSQHNYTAGATPGFIPTGAMYQSAALFLILCQE